MASRGIAGPTRRLDVALSGRVEPKAFDYWNRVMKGEAAFRGVPMAGIRAAVREVWTDLDLAAWSTDELLALAHHWFAGPASEDQLAAVLLLAEQLPERLTVEHVDALAQPLAAGLIGDWNVTDWYCVKALHRFLDGAADQRERAMAIASWTERPGLWQRRAGVVAFVNLAPRALDQFDGFVPLVLGACANNLAHEGRFAHTGPGWVLRELSKAVPDEVQGFVDVHPEMSAECRRMATARLRPGPYRRR